MSRLIQCIIFLQVVSVGHRNVWVVGDSWKDSCCNDQIQERRYGALLYSWDNRKSFKISRLCYLIPNFCSTVGEAKRTLIDVNLTRADDTIFKRGQTVSVSGVMAHMFKSRGEGDNTYLRCVGHHNEYMKVQEDFTITY